VLGALAEPLLLLLPLYFTIPLGLQARSGAVFSKVVAAEAENERGGKGGKPEPAWVAALGPEDDELPVPKAAGDLAGPNTFSNPEAAVEARGVGKELRFGLVPKVAELERDANCRLLLADDGFTSGSYQV